ncbi:uncharacterized protein LOC143915101 [Arctopsyche grandis]|uniref:uncharacterized protein LOC143915101 n=1 Tax=Arctopsyche grandis TaxID=121162 RepID=UPI00406D8882
MIVLPSRFSKRPNYDMHNCESLSTLCINVITENFDRYTREMIYLPTTIKNKLFQIASRRFQILQNIDILSSLLHPNIREIDFTNCDVTTEMIETISICHNVEKLQMVCNATVSKKALLQLISGVPCLRLLRAKKCVNIDDDFVEVLVKHCALLKILDIAKCSITDVSMLQIGRLKLSALDISGMIISDKGFNDFISGDCKETLKELIVSCTATSCRMIENELANLKIFVNHSHVAFDNSQNMKQLSWVVK